MDKTIIRELKRKGGGIYWQYSPHSVSAIHHINNQLVYSNMELKWTHKPLTMREAEYIIAGLEVFELRREQSKKAIRMILARAKGLIKSVTTHGILVYENKVVGIGEAFPDDALAHTIVLCALSRLGYANDEIPKHSDGQYIVKILRKLATP